MTVSPAIRRCFSRGNTLVTARVVEYGSRAGFAIEQQHTTQLNPRKGSDYFSTADLLNRCRRADPAVGAQPVGPFARQDGGPDISPEVGIKLSSDRGYFPVVIRKAGSNGPPGSGKAGAIHSNFGASTGARRHKPGLLIFPVRATSALLDRVRVVSPGAGAPFFEIDHVERDDERARRIAGSNPARPRNAWPSRVQAISGVSPECFATG